MGQAGEFQSPGSFRLIMKVKPVGKVDFEQVLVNNIIYLQVVMAHFWFFLQTRCSSFSLIPESL